MTGKVYKGICMKCCPEEASHQFTEDISRQSSQVLLENQTPVSLFPNALVVVNRHCNVGVVYGLLRERPDLLSKVSS